jgi:hypothetical protein
VLGLEVAVVHGVGIPLGGRAGRETRSRGSAPRRGVSQRNMSEHLVCAQARRQNAGGGTSGLRLTSQPRANRELSVALIWTFTLLLSSSTAYPLFSPSHILWRCRSKH